MSDVEKAKVDIERLRKELLRKDTEARAAVEQSRDIAASARRMLRAGQDFWEKHQHSPDSDEMWAALTDLYFALKRHSLDEESNVKPSFTSADSNQEGGLRD